MIRCVAIDDEPLALRQISNYISKIEPLELVSTFNNALDAQRFLLSEQVDLIFVDINMPDMNGIELVRSIEPRTMVIFTTAYSEYAIDGFRLDAIDYILKPFSLADFEHSVLKAVSLYELRQYKPPVEDIAALASDNSDGNESDSMVVANGEFISVKADRKVSLVRISDIVYIESEGEYVRLHISDGTRLITLFRLKNMLTTLPVDQFMRVHRSYIVNLNCVTAYTKGRVYLGEAEYVPIGDIYKDAFKEYITKRFGK